jgi:hypothetical protein
MISEAFVVIMVVMVSAIVSFLYRCWYCLSWCQSFGLGVEVSSIVESKSRGIGSVKVLWCQGIGVRCKNTGAVVCEFTLLLDFEPF